MKIMFDLEDVYNTQSLKDGQISGSHSYIKSADVFLKNSYYAKHYDNQF